MAIMIGEIIVLLILLYTVMEAVIMDPENIFGTKDIIN